MATFKSVVTVPCVSLLCSIVPSVGWEIIKHHLLLCLFSDFKSVCTSVLKSDDSCRQTRIQRDLAVCHAVCKIADGSTETAHLQISRCSYVSGNMLFPLNEAVNRSGEFTAKPGSCPTADGLYPGSEDCEWDMDCPGWQKCCQGTDHSLCTDSAS